MRTQQQVEASAEIRLWRIRILPGAPVNATFREILWRFFYAKVKRLIDSGQSSTDCGYHPEAAWVKKGKQKDMLFE
jgi:hypothetical protein